MKIIDTPRHQIVDKLGKGITKGRSLVQESRGIPSRRQCYIQVVNTIDPSRSPCPPAWLSRSFSK